MQEKCLFQLLIYLFGYKTIYYFIPIKIKTRLIEISHDII